MTVSDSVINRAPTNARVTASLVAVVSVIDLAPMNARAIMSDSESDSVCVRAPVHTRVAASVGEALSDNVRAPVNTLVTVASAADRVSVAVREYAVDVVAMISTPIAFETVAVLLCVGATVPEPTESE